MKRCICVLVVEDDPILGPMARYALEALGHDSVLATSAGSARHCLTRSNHPFEVVLLDLQLNHERSEPMIEELRKNEFRVPPIIIFSALPEDELRKAMRATDAAGYLQKPASVAEIEQAITAAVAERTT